VSEIVMVFRTFPIRVSGPQAGPLSNEITWEQLQQESAAPAPIHEHSTVTKKLRRVGRFDWEEASRAVEINRPTRLAVNFLDHISFQNRSAFEFSNLTEETKRFLQTIESRLRTCVHYLGAGPRLEDCVVPDFSRSGIRRVV
jgi:adenylosuccinate synthase